ncbi:MAG: hypothetical protein AAB836_01840 [Patescibacteria group bacterium]
MKNLFTFFERISATLVLGLLFSFGISTVLATYTPSEAPGDPYELITPNFNALLIGNGGLADPDEDNLKVEGTVTTLGGLITDYLSSESGGEIAASSALTATTFGDIYYKNSTSYSTCSSSSCPAYAAGTTLYYSTGASCTAGDYLIGCSGNLTSATSSYYYKGAYVKKLSTTYLCRAFANTTSVASTAICLSPDDSQGTTTSDI